MNNIIDFLNENKSKKRRKIEPYGPTSYHELSVKVKELYGEDISEGTIAGIATRDGNTNVLYGQMIAGALGRPVEEVFPIEEKVG